MINLKFYRSTKLIPELHSERIDATQISTNDTNKILSRTFFVHEFDEDTVEIQAVEGIPEIDSNNKSDCENKSYRLLSIKDITNKNCLSLKLKSDLDSDDDESFFAPDCQPCLELLQINNNDTVTSNIKTCQEKIEVSPNDCEELYVDINNQCDETKIDPYHFKVRQRYTLSEYSGYLAYGPELQYSEGFDLTQIQYNPNEINDFKGWLKTVSSFYSYSYVLPKKNGNKIKLDFLVKAINNLFSDSNILDYVSTKTNKSNVTVEEAKQSITLPELCYSLEKLSAVVEGVKIHSIDKSANRVVFRTLASTGLMLTGSVLNCNLWWSSDGVTKGTVLYEQVGSFKYDLDSEPVAIASMVKTGYLILETFIPFDVDNEGNIVFNPLYAINPVVNYQGNIINTNSLVSISNSSSKEVKFACEINFIGCHYLIYKEEFIAIESHGVHRYPEGEAPIAEDPRPYDVEVTYDFDQGESQWLTRDSF